MKIVHTEASCGWGGQEIRILEEARGMMARGHEILVICPRESRIFEEASKRGVKAIALPIGRKRVQGVIALRSWLKNNPVDIINTHSSTDTWLTALACKTLTNPPPLVRTRHISAKIPNNLSTRWLYTKATQHIVTTGESLRQQLIRDNGYPECMITSVPTGIDPQRFRPGSKGAAKEQLGLAPEFNYLGIIATLRSWKGHLYLLEAFAACDLPQWRLLVVGEGPMREPIQEKIAALGLGERVQLVGQQDCPELWMQALDLFCLPSYANEGVPQAILQAMLSGLPIVTTTVGAITEAVVDRKTGIIVAPRDVLSLKSGLLEFINSPERRAEYGLRARKVAEENFSLENMLSKMEAIFREAQACR